MRPGSLPKDQRSARSRQIPEQAVRAGQLNALGLIDEIYHYILRAYEETTNQGVFGRAHLRLVESIAALPVDRTMETFVTLFPPIGVYKESSADAIPEGFE